MIMTAADRSLSESWRPDGAADDFPLIVHSHLRWEGAWRRPRQLLSRMARTRRVLFIEEPVLLDDVRAERLEITQPAPNVYRVVPRLPGYLRDNYDRAITDIRALVQRAIGRGGPLDGKFAGAVQWFDTPMPAPAMLGAFNERGVVYDCMNEPVQPRFAPGDLADRERLLLERADVVFTGGHGLYESRSHESDDNQFFGRCVEAAHLATARDAEQDIDVAVAAAVASIARATSRPAARADRRPTSADRAVLPAPVADFPVR